VTSAQPSQATPGQTLPEPHKLPDAEAVHAERALQFADELLKVAPTPEGQLGLVLVLGQRSADLFWTFAVENRSAEPVLFGSDLGLLELTLTPKASLEAEADADASNAPAAPHTCNPLTKVASGPGAPLLPGEAEVFSFDPRSICPEELLTEGTTVSAIYGYAIEKKTGWQKGKKVETLLTDKPPFVAQAEAPEPAAPPAATAPEPAKARPQTATSEAAPPGLKQLFAAPMVLNETYPLDALELFAEGDPRHDSNANAPLTPLTVSLRDLGEARTPTFQLVNVTLKNVSDAPLDVVVRRELMVFEVVGPQGATTCYLEPTQVDPLAHNFTRLAPGVSRVLVTRMPEVCPAGTFSEPGTYSVFVRYRSPSDGAQFGRQGFQGEIRSKSPAHLRVPDPLKGNVQAQPVRRAKTPAASAEEG